MGTDCFDEHFAFEDTDVSAALDICKGSVALGRFDLHLRVYASFFVFSASILQSICYVCPTVPYCATRLDRRFIPLAMVHPCPFLSDNGHL